MGNMSTYLKDNQPTADDSPNYDVVAWLYRPLAQVFSFGAIERSKKAHFEFVHAGDRVLYLGAGQGDEVVRAAQRGIVASAIDISARMLDRLKHSLARRNVSAAMINADVLTYEPEAPYDAVCGHYFFNCFAPNIMPVFLDRALTLVKPGGLIVIADFAPPQGRGLASALKYAYMKSGLFFYRMLGLAANHPFWDYQPLLVARGCEIVAVRDVPMAGIGAVMFRTVIARTASSIAKPTEDTVNRTHGQDT
jgi:demethylmenaquinone methyltransferase/2-methoxy-6-polyprenyl-1,4-benzoquinol methylase